MKNQEELESLFQFHENESTAYKICKRQLKYILKVEPIECINQMDVGYEKKSAKPDPKDSLVTAHGWVIVQTAEKGPMS